MPGANFVRMDTTEIQWVSMARLGLARSASATTTWIQTLSETATDLQENV